MDENHQDKMEGKLTTTENCWYPPLSPRDQEQVDRLRKKLNGRKKAANKWRWGFSDKTGWDWLQLLLQLLTALALPVALFLATQWFSAQQSAQQAAAQQQETTYQAYLDRMSDLIENGNLADPHSSPAIRALAQSQTFAALRRSDPQRKGYIIQFLHDAGLLAQSKPIINLNLIGAVLHSADLSNATLSCLDQGGNKVCTDLSGVDLTNANLNGADLSSADLSGATLTNANLSHAHLNGATLFDAHLNAADLSGADLSHATDLTNAHLSHATLTNANLNGAILRNADLSNAILYAATLTTATLTAATLSNANLSNTHLYAADLSSADLSGTTLSNADLSSADLYGARNLTQHQLDEVHSCTKAILFTRLTCHSDQ